MAEKRSHAREREVTAAFCASLGSIVFSLFLEAAPFDCSFVRKNTSVLSASVFADASRRSQREIFAKATSHFPRTRRRTYRARGCLRYSTRIYAEVYSSLVHARSSASFRRVLHPFSLSLLLLSLVLLRTLDASLSRIWLSLPLSVVNVKISQYLHNIMRQKRVREEDSLCLGGATKKQRAEKRKDENGKRESGRERR